MTVENLANNASTTLNGTINSSTTTVIVTSAVGFPSANFRILIGSEIMLVTAKSGTTFTVTRGVESTGATSHTSGVAVTHLITAGGLLQFITDNAGGGGGASIGAGAIGSRPAAGSAGNMYIPDDGMIFQRDNGVSWDSFGPIYKFTQPPAAASFTQGGVSGPVMSDQGGSLLLTVPYTAAEARTALYIAQSSTWSVTTCLTYFNDGHNGGSTVEVGLGFINTSSGKYAWVGQKTIGGGNNILAAWYDAAAHTSASSIASGASGYVQNTAGIVKVPIWYRINYGASNRTYEYSLDGVNFQQVWTETKNLNFTPDAAAIIVSPKSTSASNTNMGANLLINIFDWH